MKKGLLVSGIAAIVLLAGFTYGGWIKYTSITGKYSINFPAKPNETVENDTAAGGIVFKIYMATYEVSNEEVYLSSVTDMHAFYPADKAMKQLLEDSRDGAAASMNATNVVTTATNLGKEPYIEFTCAISDMVAKDRIYVIDKCQYSIIKINSKDKGLGDADKFIASFKHL